MTDPKTPPALTDILGVPFLQHLQDAFASIAKATTFFVDSQGNRVTEPGNPQGVCALFSAAGAGRKCRDNISESVEISKKTGQPVFSGCPCVGGLVTATVPVIVDGLFLGCWIVSQFRIDDVPVGNFEAAARALDVPEKHVREAFHSLPCYSRENFERLFKMFRTVTETVAELGRSNMEMAKRDKELRGLTELLEDRDKALSRHIQSRADATYICDYHGLEIIMANQAFCKLVDLPVEAVIGSNCSQLLGAALPGFCALCPRSLLLDGDNQPTYPRTRDFFFEKRHAWLRCTHQALTWGLGRQAQIVTIEDVTRERLLRHQLEYKAFYDDATGLPNGNKMAEDFTHSLMEGTNAETFVICLDLSSLHLFSDAYGRHTADDMLKEIVSWLLRQDFGAHTTYRLGQCDFCLAVGKVPEQTARICAERIRERFEKPWHITTSGNDIAYVCGVSVSILLLPPGLADYQDLDDLLARTLSRGRNEKGIFVYDQEMDKKHQEHIKLVLSLKECVNNGMLGFDVHYQPIVDLASGMWTGLEALSRWTRPGFGPVSPLVFIREAESLGQINRIGTWVLDKAVAQAKQLNLDQLEHFFMSVNISAIQMMDGAFADTVADILRRHRYPGKKLNLEITESTQMTFSNFTMPIISALTSMGVRMSLDDFGTGYSSFNNLKHLPIDFLKTERDFIIGIEHDSYMQYFLYIMSEIAHANNTKLIAEGIETAEQLKIVKSNGADYIQGYFFSKPLPAEELARRTERFTVPDTSYIPATAEIVNIQQWLSGKKAYELTPSLFNLMNQCMQIMLTECDVSSALLDMFEIVGEHFSVSRVFAFVREEPGIYSNLYEWCGEHAPPQKHLLQKIPVLENTPSLQEAFRSDGMVMASRLYILPADMQAALKGQDVCAIALLPMWDEDELSGFVGFDKTTAHAWSPEEIVMLWNLAMLIANTIKREKLKIEVVEKENILDAVLQHSGFNAYVTDAETDELLWVNENMLRLWGLDAGIIGKKCYDIFSSDKKRCDFCQIPVLNDASASDQIVHVFHCEPLRRDFMAHAGFIKWAGREKAHIHYSMDVTDQRKTQVQLEELAATDMLTGALNRATIIGKLQTMLGEAKAEGALLAVAYVSLDRLKFINEHFGYDVGDQALFHTVQAIRSCTQKGDVIGRYSGDEFLVLMPGCAKGMARVRMMQSRNALARIPLLKGHGSIAFTFGTADSTDMPYTETAAFFGEFVGLAESRMKEQKQAMRKNVGNDLLL